MSDVFLPSGNMFKLRGCACVEHAGGGGGQISKNVFALISIWVLDESAISMTDWKYTGSTMGPMGHHTDFVWWGPSHI